MNLYKWAHRYLGKDNRGVTSIEYGLIAGLLGVALITVLGTVSTTLQGLFQRVATALANIPAP